MTRTLFHSSGDSLPTTADVIIIGGGPAGTAAAWALDRAMPGIRMALIEQSDRLGAGSSSASLEAFRTCWPCLPLARQMARSIEVFRNADEYLGESAAGSLAVKQHGYLFCAFDQAQAEAYAADVRRLHEIGILHIEWLDHDEVRGRFGWVGEKVIAAKFDPVAGWLDSNALIHRFAAQPKNLQIVLGVRDVRLCVEGGAVRGVEFPGGRIDAARVVIAAGAGSGGIARTAGIDLPLVMRPRQSFTTGWRHAEFPSDAPLLIGGAPYPHARPEARVGAIFGWEYAWRNKRAAADQRAGMATMMRDPVYPAEKESRFPSLTLALMARMFGHREGEGFGDRRYLRGVHHNAGYYVYRSEGAAYRTDPDGSRQFYESERAIIDRVQEVDGLVVSAAHVGHGIMSAPAAGEIAACKVLGLPLGDPSFAAFGFDATWVEYDEAVL